MIFCSAWGPDAIMPSLTPFSIRPPETANDPPMKHAVRCRHAVRTMAGGAAIARRAATALNFQRPTLAQGDGQ